MRTGTCRSDAGTSVSFAQRWLRSLARPAPHPGYLRRGTEDEGPERTGLQPGTATSREAQRPGEGPASLRRVQALRGGVQGCSPAGEPAPRIGDQSPVPGDDTQQLGDRHALPAPHAGADRDRRFSHPAL